MKILVTGGAGYVGSVCAERLLAEDHTVIVLDDLSSGHRCAVPEGAIFMEGDFGDALFCRKVIEQHSIETVMHFAAETLVEKSMSDPRAYFLTNVRKGIDFLNVLMDTGVRNFVFSSTAAVYGEPKQTPITEDHPTQPINAYGESKLMFEKVLDWYRRAYGLRFVAVRYFNASGATEKLGEDHCPESHLIPRLLESVMNPKVEFTVFGADYPTPDGTCVRDYIHVSDIAEAHVLAASALAKGVWGIFNVGCSKGYSIKEVITTAQEILGQPVNFRMGQRRAGDPATLVASNGKLSKVLGWKPRSSSMHEILRTAWQWKKAHAHGYGAQGPSPRTELANGQLVQEIETSKD